jgi:hypothetical protein
LIVFTCGLWITSIWQWKAIKKQADVAGGAADISKQALLLQFRPKLIVRNVAIDQIEIIPGGKQSAPVLRGYPIAGQFYIANIGDSTATINEILSMVLWQSDPLPMRRPYEGQNGICPLACIQLKPGQSTPWRFDSVKPLDVDQSIVLRWQNIGQPPRVNLYIMGWVEYSDDLGFVRRTAFCRQLNPQTLRLFKIDDPDYEHEE